MRSSLILAALATFLLGCAPEGPDGAHRWPKAAWPLAVVPKVGMPEDCRASLDRSIARFRSMGIDYLQVVEPGSWTWSLAGRTIVAEFDPQMDLSRHLGVTDNGRVGLDGLMHHAHARLGTCAEQTVMHELGHALGLEHTAHRDDLAWNLMFPGWVTGENFGLGADVVAWLRWEGEGHADAAP